MYIYITLSSRLKKRYIMMKAFVYSVSAMRGGVNECQVIGYDDSKHNSQLPNSGLE